jgi:hypothetical protein
VNTIQRIEVAVVKNPLYLILGIALAGGGIAVSQLDLGSPAIGGIMQLLGFGIILGSFFSRRGGG